MRKILNRIRVTQKDRIRPDPDPDPQHWDKVRLLIMNKCENM